MQFELGAYDIRSTFHGFYMSDSHFKTFHGIPLFLKPLKIQLKAVYTNDRLKRILVGAFCQLFYNKEEWIIGYHFQLFFSQNFP